MILKRKDKQRDEFSEQQMELSKKKRSHRKDVGRRASFYIQDTSDIPLRDDDYEFMVKNTMQ